MTANSAMIARYNATDAQRAYLTTLCNKGFAKRIDLGRWAGRDYRAAIRSSYLTREDASAWIEHLKATIAACTK